MSYTDEEKVEERINLINYFKVSHPDEPIDEGDTFENIFLKVTGGSYESFCERIEANKLFDMEENNMFAAYSTEDSSASQNNIQCKEFIIHPSQLLPARLKLLSCRSRVKRLLLLVVR